MISAGLGGEVDALWLSLELVLASVELEELFDEFVSVSWLKGLV